MDRVARQQSGSSRIGYKMSGSAAAYDLLQRRADDDEWLRQRAPVQGGAVADSTAVQRHGFHTDAIGIDIMRLSDNSELNSAGSMSRLSLLEMIPREDLQQIQDALAEINGVASVITDIDGNPLTLPSSNLALCEILHQSDCGNSDCIVRFAGNRDSAKRQQHPGATLCEPLGIYKAAVPIIIDDIHLANWWITRCSDTPRIEEKLAACAERIGVDAALLQNQLEKLPRVDRQGFDKTLRRIDSLTRRIATMGYQNLLLSRNLNKLHHLEDELNLHKSRLDDLVQRRTADLRETNSRLRLDVTGREFVDEKVERKYKLLQGVNQILRQTLTDQSEHRLAHTFLKAAQELTGSPLGFLVQRGGMGWRVAAMQRQYATDEAEKQRLDQDDVSFEVDGIWKRVVDRGDPVALSSADAQHAGRSLPSGSPRIESLMAIPLRKELDTSGFIVLANSRSGYGSIDQADVQDLSEAFIEASKRRQRQFEFEDRFSLALESANEGLWDYLPQTGQIYFSARWFWMLSYSSEEFPQSIETWHTLSHPDDLPFLERSMHSLCSGDEDAFTIEIRMLAQSGQWHWFQAGGRVVSRDTGGSATRIIGNLIDISKYKQVEVTLQKANDELSRLAALDDLTQIANRRRFDDRLTQEWRRARRDETSLAVIICDIDFFKNYNDAYGHLQGDDTLYRVAQAIQDTLKRPMDLVARYGGEEFAIILPATDAEGAQRVALEIKAAVDALRIAHKSSPTSDCITLSFGVASVVPTLDLVSKGLIEASDQALYRAKAKGRDRIEINPNQFDQPAVFDN
jgi:diguanylate cyclase (GGDEF)-like protein